MPNDVRPLSPARLRALIEAYGAEPRRWPAQEREVALARLSEMRAGDPGPEIEAACAAGAEMDRLLGGDDGPDAFLTPAREAALAARVLAAFPAGAAARKALAAGAGERGIAHRVRSRLSPPLWQNLAAASALLVVGMAGGWSLSGGISAIGTPAPESASDQVTEFLALAEEWEGGGELASAVPSARVTEDEA